jgi:uncharacterized membrane protein
LSKNKRPNQQSEIKPHEKDLTKTKPSNSEGSLVATRQTMSVSRSGPLPSPQDLADYEKVRPGTAELILRSFEKQLDHRISLEKDAMSSGIKARNRGLDYGLIAVLAALGVALVLGLNGHSLEASIIGGGGIAALAGVFVYGSQSQRAERQEKREQQTKKLGK